MGRSVIIWIPLYCHLKWGFVCFLSAQDVLAETRSDKSVMGTKRENVRWLADVSSVLRHWHKDTIGKSQLLNSSHQASAEMKSSLNFILDRHKQNCKISYKWQERWKSSPKQENVAKITLRWWWLNVEELVSVCQLGPRVRFPWPLIVLEIFYAIFFTEIAPTLTRH